MRKMRSVVAVSVLAVLYVVFAGCAALERDTGPDWEIRVNAGSGEVYVDQAGRTWLADQRLNEEEIWGAVGGEMVARDDIDIPDTTAPGVYRTARSGMEKYVFTVIPGTYTVRLHFTEASEDAAAPGERVFDVKIQDEVVLKQFDPFKVSGGLNLPVTEQFTGIEPIGGQITLEFVADVQQPTINGIEITGF